jgi:hypothetical protein
MSYHCANSHLSISFSPFCFPRLKSFILLQWCYWDTFKKGWFWSVLYDFISTLTNSCWCQDSKRAEIFILRAWGNICRPLNVSKRMFFTSKLLAALDLKDLSVTKNFFCIEWVRGMWGGPLYPNRFSTDLWTDDF